MEIAEVTIKESPGLCRCCLSEGCYKDLGSEYTWMNDTEIYADMLLDCFDIGITQHNDGPNGRKRLICEVCITRLRDACNFKRQVVDSERKFIDMLGRGEFRTEAKDTVYASVPVYETPLKAEAIEEVTLTEDYESNVEYLDDMDNTEDDEPVKSEPPPVPVPSTSTSAVAKRGRPKKADSGPPEKKAKLKPKVTKLPKGTKPEVKTPSWSLAHLRHRTVKINVTSILRYSTVIPFKWHQVFICFYCRLPFQNFQTLKDHVDDQHKEPKIKLIVDLMKKDEKVKIEITTINCKLCDNAPKDLDELIDHLKTHKKIIDADDYGVLPFKLLDGLLECAICNESFKYYTKLNQHMNRHFEHYVCAICGKSYLSGDRLRAHAVQHSTNFPCNSCSEVFNTQNSRDMHMKVHNKMKKCSFCAEEFTTHAEKEQHLKDHHDVEVPAHDCPICNKHFPRPSKMKNHLKSVHNKT